MNTKTKFPDWLVFADSVSKDDPWIQLLVVNPFNGETSTLTDQIIDLDDGGDLYLQAGSPSA